MSDDRIAIIQARAERQGAGSGRPVATSRRDRVARSKEQAADAGAEADAASDAIAVETEESPLVADSSMPGANQDNATEEATDTASDTAADKPEEN